MSDRVFNGDPKRNNNKAVCRRYEESNHLCSMADFEVLGLRMVGAEPFFCALYMSGMKLLMLGVEYTR